MNEVAPVPHKRESTDDRRVAIALAARDLIVEKGFEGLRTRDIAERVGINIATLHYHVPNKAALIELVAESMRDDFRVFGEKFPRDGLDSIDLLRLKFKDYREIIDTAPQLIAVFAELIMRARRDEEVRSVIGPMHSFWIGKFEQILAAGVADGSFRPDLDPVAAAHMITAALKMARRPEFNLAEFDRLTAELERAVLNPLFVPKE